MNSEFTVAVHCLVFLAYVPDHMASSDHIARNVATNPTRIRKVMGLLRANGFVKTKEGIGGGYFLSCEPGEVTLGQVYRAISTGTLKPHWCSGNREDACLISANMEHVMDEIFTDAEAHYEHYLERTTIQAVLDKVKKCQSTY